MPFGGWLNCENCGLTGDPIKVYGEVYRLDTVPRIRKALEEEFRSEDSFDEDWDLYAEFYQSYYNGVVKFWKIAQNNASNYGQSFHAKRLYDLGLWRDQNTFNNCMADKVGMVHQGQIEAVLGGIPQGVSRKPYTRMLVMPLSWVPGFITGFALIGSKDEIKYVNLLPAYFGGFFNLTNRTPRSKITMLVDSPIQVLRVILKSYIEKVELPPVVAPFDVSMVDWEGLGGILVYWHDDPPPEQLRKYLTANKCQITSIESLPEWPSDKRRMEWWNSIMCPKVEKLVNAVKKRKSTIKYCVETILDKKTNAVEYLDRLGPTIQMKHLLLNKCLSHQKRKLAALFEDIDFQETVQLKGHWVYEREGKWWIRNRKKRREDTDEVMSEVILIVDTIYRNSDLTASSYAGHLLYKGVRIDFVVKAKEIQKNPRDYIELIFAHAGIEVLPYISDWGRLNILKVSQLFHQPEVVKVRDSVGFDTFTGKFYLPQTLISTSRIEVGGQYVYPGPALPGEGMGKQLDKVHENTTGFSAALLSSWMNPYYECVGYWATVAAFMRALQSKLEGGTTTGVVLVGDKGSLAEHLFSIFRYDFDLIKSDLNSFVSRQRALESCEHDLPLAVDGLRCKKVDLRNWIDKAGTPNTLLLADPLYASSMGPDPDWTFIRAESPPLGPESLLAGTETAASSIIQYMLITQPQNLRDAFIGCEEIARNTEADIEVITRARRIASSAGYINSRSELACFLNLIDEMSEQGILGTRKEFIIDIEADEIHIDVNLIQKAAKRARLYVRRWDLRNSFKLFGFVPIGEAADIKYKGPFSVWQRLMKAVRRLKTQQHLRDKNYSNYGLK